MNQLRLFLEGTFATLEATLAAFFIAIMLGTAGAAFKMSHFWWARLCADFYTYIFRGVPEIVTIMAFYYGGSLLLEHYAPYLMPSALWGGIFALGLAYGAYATEVIRAGVVAIPRGQLEAAMAVGMSRYNRIFRVVLPLTFRHATPGLNNMIQSLLKDTALLSVIAVPELMWRTQIMISVTKRPFDYYLLAALIYMMLTLLLYGLFQILDRNNDRLQATS